MTGPGQSQADWTILDDLSRRMGKPLGFASAEAISKEISDVAPAYAGLSWDLLEWDEKEGAVVPYGDATQPLEYVPDSSGVDQFPVPSSQSPGSFALHLARTLYDDGVLMHPDDARRLGVDEGAMVEVIAGDTTVRLPAAWDPSLLAGVVYLPFNQRWTPSLGATPFVEVTAGKEVSA